MVPDTQTSSAVVLEAVGCATGYDATVVLHDISLRMAAGDFLGIIGPNGSGKSTLLKLLTGILKPWRGTVRLLGRPLHAFTPAQIARRVAVIPQEVAVLFPFTVEQIVAMGRYPFLRRLQRESSRDAEAIERALEATDTVELRGRSIDELSGGERQRVIIARALAQEPQILFLDEPTAHLDIGHQIEIFDLLRRLNHERGLSIFAISHDLNLCAEYCRTLILLDHGRIVAAGPAADIVRKERIEDVYRTEVSILANPASGAPIVTLTSHRPGREDRSERRAAQGPV